MRFARPLFLALAAGVALCATDVTAFAKHGGGRFRDRQVLSETPGASVPVGKARLRIESRGSGREELRLQIEGSLAGLSLRVFLADATGVMTDVGGMKDDLLGEYSWRLRTKKGDALPFGAASLASLSGRRLEVRTSAGETIVSGNLPSVPAVSGKSGAKKARSGLAIDAAAAESLGFAGLAAKVEVRARREGEHRFKVSVEGVPAGETFELWMENPTTGEMEFVAVLAGDGPGKKGGNSGPGGSDDDDDTATDDGDDAPDTDEDGGDGDDDGDDDGNDDGDDDGDGEETDEGLEVEYEARQDKGDALPFHVMSATELAGLRIEIRTAAGDVVASGETPAAGRVDHDDDDDAGDDHGNDDAGDETETEDEAGDDNA